MATYLRSNTARATAVVAAIGVAVVSLLTLTNSKDTLLHTLGIGSSAKGVLANACAEPQQQNDEVYFVSCAGFF